VIPIKRGAVDRTALDMAVRVLEAGELLLYLPEGTRRPAMGRAKDGMAYLVSQTRVPVIPAAVHGVEGFPSLNPKHWAQPGVQLRNENGRQREGRAKREPAADICQLSLPSTLTTANATIKAGRPNRRG
jgi:1-acyl-sn-glycerol-3-phosphate acyltransferase